MLTYLRYALATFCLAASVGSLALWWRSYSYWDQLGGSLDSAKALNLSTLWGSGIIGAHSIEPAKLIPWQTSTQAVNPKVFVTAPWPDFRMDQENIYFPIWYPALIFALASVAFLRLGRRFTLRTAIIATTVVAGLLGMAVIL